MLNDYLLIRMVVWLFIMLLFVLASRTLTGRLSKLSLLSFVLVSSAGALILPTCLCDSLQEMVLGDLVMSSLFFLLLVGCRHVLVRRRDRDKSKASSEGHL